MIIINSKEFRNINQPIYVGNTQIAQVYRGTELIYPENDIITEDNTEVVLEDVPQVYGNIYDSGIPAEKDTLVELLFKLAESSTSEYRAFFGTHDNSTTYTTNSNKYTSGTKFHFIVNGSYDMYLRMGTINKQLNMGNLTSSERKGIFWVKFTETMFSIGCGSVPGTNTKASYDIASGRSNYPSNVLGGNLWIGGHNQGMSSPNSDIRSWLGTGMTGLSIAKTDFYYVKIVDSNRDVHEFIPEAGNPGTGYTSDTSYPNGGNHLVHKMNSVFVENIYPFTYVQPS